MLKRTLYHFHFCCGLGGGGAGFNRARPRVGNVEAHWECLGGIDVDPAGLRDFERLAGVPGTLLDLFTRDQYIRFHGTEPPAGTWPDGWDGDEPIATTPLDKIFADGAVQPLLFC